MRTQLSKQLNAYNINPENNQDHHFVREYAYFLLQNFWNNGSSGKWQFLRQNDLTEKVIPVGHVRSKLYRGILNAELMSFLKQHSILNIGNSTSDTEDSLLQIQPSNIWYILFSVTGIGILSSTHQLLLTQIWNSTQATGCACLQVSLLFNRFTPQFTRRGFGTENKHIS